jgi:hypothetical protein
MNLSWACADTNNPPLITDLFISPGTKFIGSKCDVIVTATDPDGDNLSYKWNSNGGIFDDVNISDTEWTAPNTPGTYKITITIEDGRGGADTKTKSVTVNPLPLQSIEVPLGEAGYIVKDEFASSGLVIQFLVGDWDTNKPVRGFVSFDISALSGATISDATLSFLNPIQHNSPYDNLIEALRVKMVDWGDDVLEIGDYDLPSKPLGEYSDPSIIIDSQALIDALQAAINNGRESFQIMVSHKGWQSNNNNVRDFIQYARIDIKLNVEYIVP